MILFPTLEELPYAFVLGFSFFLATLLIDSAINVLILRQDTIYNRRRIMALSLFCWGLWLLFMVTGIMLAGFLGLVWAIRLCLLGFSAVNILRLIVLSSTSSTGNVNIVVASILNPLVCMIPFLILWTRIGYSIIPIVYFFAFSSGVSIISSMTFISVLNSVGIQNLGVPSLPLFKAFLINWIADLNAPFEGFLEKLGENRSVEVSLIKFNSSKLKAIIVVPSIHPGPFKNVGSSLLPSMLKTTLERKLNCVACVPHGLFGHEFDLASQIQNQKIISQIVESTNCKVSSAKATPLIKVCNELVTAYCQVFGDFALLSFTLAPKTTEDLPHELGLFVQQEGEKYGLEHVIVVNAHNSIDGVVNLQEVLTSLKDAAATCLRKASALIQTPFEIGAATFVPKEYSLKEGMGPGGISAIVVNVGKRKNAYVVIDGNNMVSGLREKILSTLNSVGIDEGEVFTTDTHSVNATILSGRGYHPIGEVINHESLIEHIKNVTLAASSGLGPAKVGYASMIIPDIKVIGERRLETLCLLIDKTLQKAKKVALPLFSVSGILLMLFLLFV